jgi:lysyl-tRNA synthetase class 2
MELTERLVEYVTESVNNGQTTITFNGEEIDMSSPWERRSFDELVDEYITENINSENEMDIRNHLEEQFNVDVDSNATYDEVLLELFEEAIEPELIGPIFVTDYPTVSTPLCRTHDNDSSRVQRFESFVCGMEIANAYTELTNPIEQRDRFIDNSGNADINSEFIEAIANGMPPTGGLGIGMDRIAMILTDSQSIKDVIPYPLTPNRI